MATYVSDASGAALRDTNALLHRIRVTACAVSDEGERGTLDGHPVVLMTAVQLKAADMLARVSGVYERDNRQQAPTIIVAALPPGPLPPSDPIE